MLRERSSRAAATSRRPMSWQTTSILIALISLLMLTLGAPTLPAEAATFASSSHTISTEPQLQVRPVSAPNSETVATARAAIPSSPREDPSGGHEDTSFGGSARIALITLGGFFVIAVASLVLFARREARSKR